MVSALWVFDGPQDSGDPMRDELRPARVRVRSSQRHS